MQTDTAKDAEQTSPRRGWFRCGARCVGWALLLALAGSVVGWVTVVEPSWRRPFTLLLMGSDNRAHAGPSRSDTMMLLRIDPERGTIRGLALPRDLFTPIQGLPIRRTAKLNSALFWGEYLGGDGLKTAEQTVAALVGVPVDAAVVVHFGFVRKLVDALGGVEVYCDNQAYGASDRKLQNGKALGTVRFESGWNYLDGGRALDFIRVRKPDFDFGRVKRNRALAQAVAGRLRAPGGLRQVRPHVFRLLREVNTDLGVADCARAAWVYYLASARDIEWVAIDKAGLDPVTTSEKAQVLVARPGTLEKAVDEWLQREPPAPAE